MSVDLPMVVTQSQAYQLKSTRPFMLEAEQGEVVLAHAQINGAARSALVHGFAQNRRNRALCQCRSTRSGSSACRRACCSPPPRSARAAFCATVAFATAQKPAFISADVALSLFCMYVYICVCVRSVR